MENQIRFFRYIQPFFFLQFLNDINFWKLFQAYSAFLTFAPPTAEV